MENRSRVVNNRTNRTNKTNKAAEYQYGSAVRKLQAVPEVRTYEPKRRDEEREQERRLRRREIRTCTLRGKSVGTSDDKLRYYHRSEGNH